MPRKKHADRSAAYEFWRWEYQRRNEKYKADYQEVVNRLKKVKGDAQRAMLERVKRRIKNERAIKTFWEAQLKDLTPGDTIFRFSRGALKEHEKALGEKISDKDAKSAVTKEDKELRDQERSFLEYEIGDEFASKHGRWPTDPEKGLSPDDMLKKILEGTFTHDISMVPSRRVFVTGFGHISGKHLLRTWINLLREWLTNHPDKNIDLKIIREAHILLGEKKSLNPDMENPFAPFINMHYMEIDISKPLDVLKAALSYYYNSLKRDQQGLYTSFKQLSKATIEEEKFKSAKEYRAIGLWLWDYAKLKKVSPKVAIRKFEYKYILPDGSSPFGKQFFEESALSRAYSEADQRISDAANP